jgi:hypothetical protein
MQSHAPALAEQAKTWRFLEPHANYEAAQEWLLEDEYERVKGQLLAEEVF